MKISSYLLKLPAVLGDSELI